MNIDLVKYFKDAVMLTTMLEFAAIVAITLLAAFISNLLLKKVYQRLLQTDNYWDDAIIHSVHKPVILIVLAAGLLVALDQLGGVIEADFRTLSYLIAKLLFVFAITWFMNELIGKLDKYWYEGKSKHKIDQTTAGALIRLLKIILFLLAGLFILQTLGYSVAALAAFLGGGGLAVGFSAKDMIANFFGALTIYLDRPFKVGDWVRSPEKDIEGIVEDIGLRVTRIRNFDMRPIYVPNSVFSTIVLENASRMTHRRVLEIITIRHKDQSKVNMLSERVVEKLLKHKYVDSSQDVVFTLFATSIYGLNMELTAFTKQKSYGDFHAAKHHILETVIKTIEENGAKVVEYQPSKDA